MLTMRFSNVLAAGGGLLICGVLEFGAASAQAQGQAVTAPLPDVSGGWVRRDDAGSGSYDGLFSKVPPASLTPVGAAMPGRRVDPDDVNAGAKPHAVGDPYIVTAGYCGGGGGGEFEPNSAGLFIVQTSDEVLFVRESPGGRHIYMDGRAHPDPTRWTPSGYGHSVGRYENGALVIDTTGLTTGVVAAGGRRTPETHVAERVQVSPDRTLLTITYTWTDPKLYLKPHTYQLTFDRVPPGGYAFEGWCDSSDPLQRQSIVPPKQLP